jgi:hypothetical protein
MLFSFYPFVCGGGAAEWIAYLQFTKKTELKKLNKNK